MLRVALTGGIATGKSYVLQQCRTRRIPCLDADTLAHGAMVPGTEVTTAIVARFGPKVLASDGSIDRSALGRLVFADRSARLALEAIVHPAVYRAIAAGLRAFELLGADPLAVVDVPLLYESGHQADFDRVIVTSCSLERQIARLLERGLDETAARQRISAQWPTADKAARADFVITTEGSFEDTDAQLERILASLKS